MTYVPKDKILFSGGAFRSYSIPEVIFSDESKDLDRYLRFTRKYFANIIGGFRDWVSKAISKIVQMNLDIQVVAPLHGLVWRGNIDRIISYYDNLAKPAINMSKIVVIYGSMYGSVEKGVLAIIKALKEKGLSILTYRFTDKEYASASEVIGEAYDAAALVIGAPTYESSIFPAVKYMVELIVSKVPAKPIIIVSSYGWGGVAGKKLSEIFDKHGYEVIDIIEYRGQPNEGVREKITSAVEKLLEKII